MEFNNLRRLLFGGSALIASLPLMAGQQSFEARSDAMGGTAVASASRLSSIFVNPALMNISKNKTNDLSILLPAVGIEAGDPDSIIDQIDDIQDFYTSLDDAINSQNVSEIETSRDSLVTSLEDLDNSQARIDGGVGFAVILADFDNGSSSGLFYKSYFNAFIVADVDNNDINDLKNIDPLNPPKLEDLKSEGVVSAGAITDIGIAYSYPVLISDIPFSFGASPKIQRIDTYQYAINVNNFELDDAMDDQYRTDTTTFNMDIGLAAEPMKGVIVALTGRNLFKQEVKTTPTNNQQLTYQVEPQFTAGISYDWSILSFTSDIDINKHGNFKEIDDTECQFIRVGGEVRPISWVAVRMGYRKDIENNSEDLLTAGLGLSVFNTFNIDIAGVYGDNDTVGATLQTSFYF